MWYSQELQEVVLTLLAHASICHLSVRMIADRSGSFLKRPQLFHRILYPSIDQPSKKSLCPYATAYSSPHLTTPRVYGSRMSVS